MATLNLSGLGVALVTPFRTDKSIDYEALANLVDRLINKGCNYLVVLGTTAETPTLTDEEKMLVKATVRKANGGRVPMILGMGGNDTLRLAHQFENEDFTGFEAALSVVPFYNKPSQEGICRHYATIAEVSPVPIVLYNVPGRTGVNMTAATTLRLAKDFDNIIGVKEASGNLKQIEEIIHNKPEGFQVISGDDGITFPLMTLGAVGVISVIGNAYPLEFGNMVRLCLKGEYGKARTIHDAFSKLFELLFIDGNPAGVKCALNALGLIENELRLPLVPIRMETNDKIHSIINDLPQL